MSLPKVAKTLSIPKGMIKAAEIAAKSTTAMQALSDGQLSLLEAAAITEFEVMWTHARGRQSTSGGLTGASSLSATGAGR
jgi:ParB family transcriptional regulator, chromosome partitioning protein